MAPGTRSKFGAPMFEPEVFRKQMCCSEESTCDFVGTFRRNPQSFGALRSDLGPGNYAPLSPLVTSLGTMTNGAQSTHATLVPAVSTTLNTKKKTKRPLPLLAITRLKIFSWLLRHNRRDATNKSSRKQGSVYKRGAVTWAGWRAGDFDDSQFKL